MNGEHQVLFILAGFIGVIGYITLFMYFTHETVQAFCEMREEKKIRKLAEQTPVGFCV